MATGSSNINILVEARNEYLTSLHKVMCPSMIDTYRLIFKEARDLAKGRKVMIKTQLLLKEVLHWNHHMIKEHTETITASCSWFNELLAAIFVSFIKILSSVRINNNTNQFATKVPNTELFVHRCYIEGAKDLYKDPFILEKDDLQSYTEIYNRISECIDLTVRELVPMQQILDAYISADKIEQIEPDGSDNDDDDTENEDDDDGDDPIINPSEPLDPPFNDEPRDITVDNKVFQRTSNITSTPQPSLQPQPQPQQPPPITPSPHETVLFPDAPTT